MMLSLSSGYEEDGHNLQACLLAIGALEAKRSEEILISHIDWFHLIPVMHVNLHVLPNFYG